MTNESEREDPTKSVPVDADGDRLPDAEWVAQQRKSMGAAGVGVQFGFTIVAFALLGLWADGKFDTSPWLTVLGVAIGFGGGTYSLLKKFT